MHKMKRFTINGKSFNKAILLITEVMESSGFQKSEGSIIHIGDGDDDEINNIAFESTGYNYLLGQGLRSSLSHFTCYRVAIICKVEILWSI